MVAIFASEESCEHVWRRFPYLRVCDCWHLTVRRQGSDEDPMVHRPALLCSAPISNVEERHLAVSPKDSGSRFSKCFQIPDLFIQANHD